MKRLSAIIAFFLLLTTPVFAQFGACLPGFCTAVTIPPVTCTGGSVVLLMPFSGVNGSTGSPGMDDISPAAHGTATAQGVAAISTAQFKFSPSSLRTGVEDFINYGTSADWGISAANADQFTIEYWVDFNTLASGRSMIGLRHVADGTYGFNVQTNGTEITFAWSPTGLVADIQTITTSGAGLATGSFIPIAVTKDGAGTIRIFINGITKASSTPANSVIHNTGVTGISIGGTAAASNGPDAWIDEVRINKGKACYVANYTPSPVPFSP